MQESNVKLLTRAAMVDNLAEKIDKCPLNRGLLGARKVSVIRFSGVSLSGVPLYCDRKDVNSIAMHA